MKNIFNLFKRKKDIIGKCTTCKHNDGLFCTVGNSYNTNVLCYKGELWEKN